VPLRHEAGFALDVGAVLLEEVQVDGRLVLRPEPRPGLGDAAQALVPDGDVARSQQADAEVPVLGAAQHRVEPEPLGDGATDQQWRHVDLRAVGEQVGGA
jgi:hypothetical protein